MTDVIVAFHFGYFLPFYPPNSQTIKIQKKEPHDVDIILGSMIIKWSCLITKGGGGQESEKKWLHNKWMLPTYVIGKLLSN